MDRKSKRVRRTRAALAAALLLAALGAGCARPAPKQVEKPRRQETAVFPVVITDDAGRTVRVKQRPERVVSLAPANTEIVAALGLTGELVGVTTYDDYPPEVASIAKVGDFVSPNLEAIAAAKPDLVLVTTGVQSDVIAKIEGLGAVVIAIDPKDVEGVYADIVRLGKALGEPTKATEVVASMRKDLDAISRRISKEPPVRTFLEIAQNPLYTAGKGTLLDDLLARAGGVNVVTQEGYVGYSLERLLKDDPAAYLATKGSMSDPADLAKRPGFDKIAAVRAGRVSVLDDNLVSRPGPRVVLGVESIARALHPDAFAK
ncbi:MAG: helical backbone metal receptor [Coriobacteriia bacterium]